MTLAAGGSSGVPSGPGAKGTSTPERTLAAKLRRPRPRAALSAQGIEPGGQGHALIGPLEAVNVCVHRD